MTLSPHISQQFSNPIWRMEIDARNDVLFAESRNIEDKTVSFSSVDLKNGEIYFDGLTTPERWLTGMEAAWDGVLLIHYYQSEAGPVHKGLMAVDSVNGQTIWTNFSYSFDHMAIKGPVVYDNRIQPRKLLLADIKTGIATRIYEPYIDPLPPNYIQVPQQISVDALPAGLPALHPYANWVHYLEYNNFRIVSLHALKTGTLIQTLYIFDEDKIVYEDLLNTDIQKIQPEAFILHKNCLIYIKNKTELKVLSL